MQNIEIITRVFSVHPDEPKYKLSRQWSSNRSVFFAFSTPDGEIVTKLPKVLNDGFGRSCYLHVVYFCESINELQAAPIYWPITAGNLVAAPKVRSKKG